MTYTFEVPGPPKAKGRARFARVGKFVRTYTPTDTMIYENRILACFLAKYGNTIPITGPFALSVRVFKPIPKAFSKGKHHDAMLGILRPETKPDWSNTFKAVEDALQGVAFDDDKRMVDPSGSGVWYSDRPRVEVQVWEIGDHG